MVDLNLWRLAYDAVDLEFGTHETGYPLTKQVDIGAAETELGDMPRSGGDGLLFGVDYARGRTLTFEGAHIDTSPQATTRQWEKPLDLAQPIAAAWDAERLRARSGAVATLTNVDRRRLVYGRPRGRAPGLELVRRGWSTWSGTFHTIDQKFYDADERSATATVQPGTTGGITAPFMTPLTTSAVANSRAWVVSAGAVDTYPVLEFFGESSNPRVELLDGAGAVLWAITFAGYVAYDALARVDARPWARSVTYNGTPLPGLLRGSRFAELRIPPGATELRYTATADPTGAAGCTIRWRDAYLEL